MDGWQPLSGIGLIKSDATAFTQGRILQDGGEERDGRGVGG